VKLARIRNTKDTCFPSFRGIDPKINIYIKPSMIIYKLRCRTVCNSGSTLWNSWKEGKEKNNRASVILHTIRCEGRGYKDVY
jgi:hypothetical protein